MPAAMKSKASPPGSTETVIARKAARALFVVILFAGAVYIITRTNYFNGDGIGHVTRVMLSDGRPELSPRYFLYYPFLALIYKASGNDPLHYLRLLQLANALLAGLALGLVFTIVAAWTKSKSLALLVSAAVAFSFVFWEFATDLHHVMAGFTALLLSIALPIFLSKRRASMGLASALSALGVVFATLWYLGNCFALFPVAWSLWRLWEEAAPQKRLRALGIFALTILLAFCAAGLLAIVRDPNISTPADFIAWLAARNPTPGWSEFTAATPWKALSGLLNAFQNFYTGLKTRDLLSGRAHWRLLPAQASLATAAAMLLFLACALLFFRRRIFKERPQLLPFSLIWILPFSLFNAYQCPEDEQYWITTLVPIFILAAYSLKVVFKRPIFILIPCLFFFGNLSSPMLEWHDSRHLEEMKAAQEVASFLGPEDAVLALAYDWTKFIPLLARRQVFGLPGLADRADTGRKSLEKLMKTVAFAEERGGRTYLAGVSDLDNQRLAWLESITKIPRAKILSVAGRRTWEFAGESLWEISPDWKSQAKAGWQEARID